ncbi:MAG: hypothetical protein K0S61_3388 [Anaerocolumna sp.]|jgi:hypothetical protein|nr:hypothetical protein [Anaerocolumna sp.]
MGGVRYPFAHFYINFRYVVSTKSHHTCGDGGIDVKNCEIGEAEKAHK